MAAHLRTFLKECGSFAHTIFPGKRFHLRTQCPRVNVTFAHIKFSTVHGMFALAGMYRQAKQSGTKPKQVIKKITETSYFSSSLHQSNSVKFFLIKLKYAGFYIIKMLMGDAAR